MEIARMVMKFNNDYELEFGTFVIPQLCVSVIEILLPKFRVYPLP
jgi:hypothetical protein